MNEEKILETIDPLETKFKGFTRKLSQYASLILGIGIAVWWVFYGTVEIYETEIAIEQKIGITFSTIVLALSYCKLISHGGFKAAKDTNAYKTQTAEWSAEIKNCIQDRQAVNKFAKDEATNNLNIIRRQYIENNELVYSEFFDESGKFIGIGYKKRKDLTKAQKKVIAKLLKLKIKLPNLFGASSSKVFGLQKEETQKQFEAKTDISQAIIRIVLSFVSVSFMFNFLGFSINSVCYALFQIVLWTTSGFTHRVRNYDWVLSVALPQIVEKKLILIAWSKLDENQKNKYRGITTAETEMDKILENIA